jgi:hypothetical protein
MRRRDIHRRFIVAALTLRSTEQRIAVLQRSSKRGP